MRAMTSSNAMVDQREVNALDLLALAKVVDYRKENWTRGIGLVVSEDMARALPDACEICSGGGTVTHYEELIPVLIKAVQELSEKVEALSKKSSSEKVEALVKKPSTKKVKDKANVS